MEFIRFITIHNLLLFIDQSLVSLTLHLSYVITQWTYQHIRDIINNASAIICTIIIHEMINDCIASEWYSIVWWSERNGVSLTGWHFHIHTLNVLFLSLTLFIYHTDNWYFYRYALNICRLFSASTIPFGNVIMLLLHRFLNHKYFLINLNWSTLQLWNLTFCQLIEYLSEWYLH